MDATLSNSALHTDIAADCIADVQCVSVCSVTPLLRHRERQMLVGRQMLVRMHMLVRGLRCVVFSADSGNNTAGD